MARVNPTFTEKQALAVELLLSGQSDPGLAFVEAIYNKSESVDRDYAEARYHIGEARRRIVEAAARIERAAGSN